MQRFLIMLICLLGLSNILTQSASAHEMTPPNIIVIYVDDMGYGDLGCYGHPSIKTPRLDQMAREGIRFTDYYSPAEVCTPSRAGLLTGRYPIRSGMSTGGRRVLFPESTGGLPSEEWTLAEALKAKGYRTAHIGKWHLGIHQGSRPLDQGFDESFGLPYSNDMDARKDLPKGAAKSATPPEDGWNVPILHNGKVVEMPAVQKTLTQRYTDHAIEFMKASKGTPTFIYLAHNMPHTPLFASQDFHGKSARGLYGDVVEELDFNIGRLLDSLVQEKLAAETIVFFTSDNGPWLTQGLQGGSAGLLKEGKGSTWEGGMRVPGIVWWPGKIKPAVCNLPVSSLDIYPTALALSGALADPQKPLDGVDLSPILFANGSIPDRPYFFYREDKIMACRLGKYKAHFFTQAGYGQPKPDTHQPPLLFNLTSDPSENYNIAAEHPEIIQQIEAALSTHQATVITVKPQLK